MIVLFLSGVFNPVILHPNVFPSGKVSLSLIDKSKGWKPQITTKEVTIKTVFTFFNLMFWQHMVCFEQLLKLYFSGAPWYSVVIR